MKASAFPHALIHRSAWKGYSRNFAYPEFSEVPIPALCLAPSLCGGISYVGFERPKPFLHKTLSGAERWDGANFALTAFSEVRHTLVTPSNSKDTLFGRCAIPYYLGTLPPNKSRQRPRTAPRRRWAPKGAWGASSATGCLRYLPTQRDMGRKGS